MYVWLFSEGVTHPHRTILTPLYISGLTKSLGTIDGCRWLMANHRWLPMADGVQMAAIGHRQPSIVFVIYRPPNTDTDVFINTLNTFIEKIKPENKYCYLLGDYNINILNYATHSATADFVDSLFSYGFLPLISRLTRVTTSSATLIDNIFTNNFNHSTASSQGILVTDVSDHFPIFHMSRFRAAFQCTFLIVISKPFKMKQIGLKSTHNITIQGAFSWFYSWFKNLCNKDFPVQKVKLRYNDRKPCLTDALINNRSEQKINHIWNIWK